MPAWHDHCLIFRGTFAAGHMLQCPLVPFYLYANCFERQIVNNENSQLSLYIYILSSKTNMRFTCLSSPNFHNAPRIQTPKVPFM